MYFRRCPYPRNVRFSLLFVNHLNIKQTMKIAHPGVKHGTLSASSPSSSSSDSRRSCSSTRSSIDSNIDTNRQIARPWVTLEMTSLQWNIRAEQYYLNESTTYDFRFVTDSFMLESWSSRDAIRRLAPAYVAAVESSSSSPPLALIKSSAGVWLAMEGRLGA